NRTGTLSLHVVGDERPLATLPDIEMPDGITAWGREEFGYDRRVHLIPDANLLVTIPATNDRLVLHKLNMQAILAKSDLDYLFVTSQPPNSVQRGFTYKYPLVVKSKKGGLKYRLDDAPKGATISAEGLLTWTVPNTHTKPEVDVIVGITDAGGQETLHSFTIHVKR